MHRALRYLPAVTLAVVLASGLMGTARSAPPLGNLIHFERIDANPNKSYPLSDKNGPWLIMATTFQGPTAAEDADKLVHEFRRRYKLLAYTYQKTFDYSAPLPSREVYPHGGQHRMRYNQPRMDEIAVLIGDFDAVDDPRAKQVLKRVRVLRPEALGGDREKKQMFAVLREQLLPESDEQKKMGPMRLAFITTNPLIPETYYRPKGVDSAIVEMNRGFEYTLLDCPGPYTLKIATFNGNGRMIDPSDKKQLADVGKMPNRLVVAAERAHEVTVFLRASHIEAYEFHDRNSSIVTVGSFASLGAPQIDGSIRYTPQIQATIDQFKAGPMKLRDGTLGPVVPRSVKAIHTIYLDPQPQPIEVPQQSFSGGYHMLTVH